jgi:hypothetical protein
MPGQLRPARLGQTEDQHQPHQVGQKQVKDLQPHRRQEQDGRTRRQLDQQQAA